MTRPYPIQVAEKGGRGVRVVACGRSGHGSMPRSDNAVVALAEAVARVGTTTLPVHITATTRALLREVAEALGGDFDPLADPASLAALGQLRAWVEPTLRNTITPTVLRGGWIGNVIPSEAEATLDCRFVPGGEQALDEALDHPLGSKVEWEPLIDGPAVEAPWDHPLPEAMATALRAEDPIARAAPFMIPAATDAKNLSPAGHGMLRVRAVATASRFGFRVALSLGE